MLNLNRQSISRPLGIDPYLNIAVPSPADFGLPEQYTEWRKWQYAIIERVLDSPKRFFGLCSPCGTGKSVVAMAAAQMSGKRTVLLTSTLGLQNQVSGDFKIIANDIRGMSNYGCVAAPGLGLSPSTTVSDAPCQMGYKCSLRFGGGCQYFDDYREAQKANIIVTNYQCWLWDKMRSGEGLHSQSLRDECFPAGTLVGDVPIENIRVGDYVDSFNEHTLLLEPKRVIRTIRSVPRALCVVLLENGQRIICTPNHPFYTSEGWKSAKDLHSSLSVLYTLNGKIKGCSSNIPRSYRNQLCGLREAHDNYRFECEESISEGREGSLQYALCRTDSQYTRTAQSVWRQDAKQSPDAQSRNARKNAHKDACSSQCVCRTVREMAQRDGGSFDTLPSPRQCNWMADGSRCSSWREAYKRDAYTLSSGCSEQDSQGGYRGGRGCPQAPETENNRREAGSNLDWVGVDNIKIYEQGSGDGFERLCPDNLVYNLTVEGNSTYTANGCIVHNCGGPRLPKVDMLVCDEVDLCENELVKFVSIDISRRECLHLGLSWPDSGQTIEDWQGWAESNQDSVESRLAKLEGRLKVGGNDKSKGNGNGNGNDSNSPDTSKGWSRDLKSLRDMKRKLSRLSDIRANDDWVMQEKETDNDDSYTSSRTAIINLKSVQFSPLSPARYAESTLWRGVEKVVLMSATVRPKTLQLLGIRDDDMEFIEFPSTFDAKRRPVIVVPAGIQMNYRNEQNDLKMLWWLGRLDAILGARLDRKGIIHTHSYGRAKFIFDNSAHSRYMLIHNSRDRDRVIDEFKNSTSPLILVSPSVDTGYDFPMEQCEYQIIAKLPFQSTTDKLVKARQARDKDYGIFITSQNIIQMAGRGMRSEIDQCETIILDDSFSDWFYRRAKGYFPEWFIKSIVRADGIPEPLPRLGINVEK